jgi:hypothetical protein
MGVWLFEIVAIKTWDSMAWLKHRLYSPLIIIPFTVWAYILPFYMERKVDLKGTLVPFVILCAIAVICFTIGKRLCFALYNNYDFDGLESYSILILSAFALFALLGFTCWFVANLRMGNTRKRNTVFITLLLIFTVPLSLFTVQLIPGLGSGDDWIDAVKMGYPVFWITVFMGLSGIFISRQNLFVPKYD